MIIFALTGAFLGFMLSNAAPIAFSATNYEKSNMSSLVRPILFAKKANLEESTLSSKPMQLKDLYQIASQNYPQLDITKINIYNYRLDNSQIMFSGYLKNEKARSSSRLNPMYIILNSKTAELVEKKELEDSHIMKKTLSAFCKTPLSFRKRLRGFAKRQWSFSGVLFHVLFFAFISL